MSANVEDLFAKMGEQSESSNSNGTLRYRLTKKAIIKALAQMPDEAAIWNNVQGQGEEDAKRVIRDALWSTLESSVKPMAQTPNGDYVEVR